MSNLTCFYKDHFMPLNVAGFPVTDLGVQRGYGIFDFLRVTENKALFIDDHLDRFCHSAKEMRLPLPYEKAALKELIQKLISQNDLPHSGIRILLSGGTSPDGYKISQPNLVIIQQPITPPADEIYKAGYKLVTYAHQRQMPHVKTTDYLMAIWLQPWVKEQGGDDVLYHQNGIVSECPRSNFFMVTQSGAVVTPGRNILAGITRKQLLAIAAAHGIVIEIKDISLDDIWDAREVFITSSTKRLIPVHTIDDLHFGPYKEDSVTAELYRIFLQKEKQTIHNA
jgi:D-alanine transaminase/branched-chain amino acid aminotransferase